MHSDFRAQEEKICHCFHIFSFCPQSFQASGCFPMSRLFTSDDQNTGASASASVLPPSIQGWSPLRLTGLISLLSKGISRASPATHFEGINSLAFCLLYDPAVTTRRDRWEDHNLDYMDLCWQSTVSAFQHTVYVCPHFPAKKQSSSDFIAAVTVCSDFGAQEEEICHYFHISPFYLPCSNEASSWFMYCWSLA